MVMSDDEEQEEEEEEAARSHRHILLPAIPCGHPFLGLTSAPLDDGLFHSVS